MSHTSLFARGALAAAVLAGLSACDDGSKVLNPPVVNPIFNSYVSIGNSITAGMQSGGLNDSLQKLSYAYLLAGQMGTRFAYPSLVAPGCPPPVATFFTGVRQTATGLGVTNGSTCLFRGTTTDILNNVAVPNASSFDPAAANVTAAGTDKANPLETIILGGKTQVQKAIDAHPTFVTIWIGNNDVLGGAISGVPAAATPSATFNANVDKIFSDLAAGAPGVKGVVIGVVNVKSIPHFFPASALSNTLFTTGINAYTGKTVTVDPTTCPPTNPANAGSLISFRILDSIKTGGHPALISCAPTTLAPAPVGDAFVLTTTEQAAITTTVTGYNTYLAQKAATAGLAFWDPNLALDSLRNAGKFPTTVTLKATNVTTGSTTLSAVAGGYARTTGSFITDGFYPGMSVTASGFTSAANNGSSTVTAVTATSLTVTKTPAPVVEAAAAARTILSAPGFGPYMSFDGIHPSANSHILITNYLIDAINAKYGTSIPKLANPTA